MFLKIFFVPFEQNLGFDACKKNKNKQNKNKLLGYWFCHVLSKLKKTLNSDV